MSTIYTPDSWEIIELMDTKNNKHHRVLAGWSGSYMYGTSWKISSGFVSVFDMGDYWKVPQSSGSVYLLYKHSEHASTATSGILNMFNNSTYSMKIVNLSTILKDYGIIL